MSIIGDHIYEFLHGIVEEADDPADALAQIETQIDALKIEHGDQPCKHKWVWTGIVERRETRLASPTHVETPCDPDERIVIVQVGDLVEEAALLQEHEGAEVICILCDEDVTTVYEAADWDTP